MQTTFLVEPEEWSEKFWKKIMPLFDKRRIRITVEEVEEAPSLSQFDVYLKMKELQDKFPPIKVDPSIDLSKLADESNDMKFI